MQHQRGYGQATLNKVMSCHFVMQLVPQDLHERAPGANATQHGYTCKGFVSTIFFKC